MNRLSRILRPGSSRKHVDCGVQSFRIHWPLLLLVVSAPSFGQLSPIRARIDSIAGQAKGMVGVAAIDLGSGDTLSLRGDGHFPMQSVFKFPLALAVLNQVDRGVLALKRPVHIAGADLHPATWSPLRQAYPAGDIDLPLDSLLAYTVVWSDNNACDILFRLLGGTAVVDRYVHRLGIRDIAIVANEDEMHQAWEVQYRNWSSPRAMAALLRLFANGGILSRESREYLWQLMASRSSGSKRIRGLLPPGAVVPHKTGSSGTNEKGIAAATNDIGILVLPGGRRIALVVFVSESAASDDQRDMVIASIARAVWDYCSAH